jgi:hypothetical protein
VPPPSCSTNSIPQPSPPLSDSTFPVDINVCPAFRPVALASRGDSHYNFPFIQYSSFATLSFVIQCSQLTTFSVTQIILALPFSVAYVLSPSIAYCRLVSLPSCLIQTEIDLEARDLYVRRINYDILHTQE